MVVGNTRRVARAAGTLAFVQPVMAAKIARVSEHASRRNRLVPPLTVSALDEGVCWVAKLSVYAVNRKG